MEIDSVPTEVDEMSRRVSQLEIEKQALKHETDLVSRDRLAKLEKELADLNEQLQATKARWQSEKDVITRIAGLKEKIEQSKAEAEKAQREAAYERASMLQYDTLPKLQKDLEGETARLASLQKDGALLKEEVSEEDIAEIVSKWTGVPVAKMLEGEIQRLVHLEAELHQRVIGQNEAVKAVATAVRRARAGLKDPNRPVGSFLFLGPTGVGKTELARALAAVLFDDERALIRIDMSEYMEKHSVARMIGAPPGYVGHDEGGQLTEAVRRRPFSVILLDEIEKAHADVFNVLLQVMDDGRLTDGRGRTVDFKNTILIMTSNLASTYILEHAGADMTHVRRHVDEALKAAFKPEFLNRIDDTIVFTSLREADLLEIVDLQLARLRKTLADRRIDLVVTDLVKGKLIEEGYDPAFGARPLKRAIQRLIQDPLALRLLDGTIAPGATVRATLEGDEILLQSAEVVVN
jgi:ATP-dependent Clp protease ATP-binding subunit ClpB